MSRLFQRYSSPAAFLDHQLHAIQVAFLASEVFRQWPDLRQITERFCWMVGDRIRLPVVRGTGGPAAAECLVDAFSWLDTAPERWTLTASAAKSVFVAGLLYNAPYITHLNVQVDGQPWTITDGEPMCALLARGCHVDCDVRSDRGRADTDGMAANRVLLLSRMYPDGGHMSLDLDLAFAVFPPHALMVDLFGSDEVE
ncbi:hypothetical protein [Luteimonas sp. MHLX1A]|uniref:hypothetical protein n=1 Tax=Alterluteimonas muca TaxID=2878684 RepID=UPI001E580354|nr:hypothetical protein [Luteimonas sp. MHLX1A]MCD9046931.1 hypothetical protein [Luteimonas sp. MHLX1A]